MALIIRKKFLQVIGLCPAQSTGIVYPIYDILSILIYLNQIDIIFQGTHSHLEHLLSQQRKVVREDNGPYGWTVIIIQAKRGIARCFSRSCMFREFIKVYA